MARRYGTVIVGAGPYGLSVAAHLGFHGIAHRALGRVMETWWESIPADALLRSEASVSSLWDPEQRYSLRTFLERRQHRRGFQGPHLSVETFREYGAWFQESAVPGIDGSRLTRLSRRLGGFTLLLANGEEMPARNVVVATGMIPFRHVPAALAGLPHELVSHSSDHTGFASFRDRDVVVVGAGQSALETAARLLEAGANVRILAREDRVVWDRRPAGRGAVGAAGETIERDWVAACLADMPKIFALLPRRQRSRHLASLSRPRGAWWLRARVADKGIIHTSREIARAEERGGKAHLVIRGGPATCELDVDHVIAATGFRRDLEKISFIPGNLREDIHTHDGMPRLKANYESSVPNLFFVGCLAASSFGPAMLSLHGARHAAAAVAGCLAAEQRHRCSAMVPAAAALRAVGSIPGPEASGLRERSNGPDPAKELPAIT